MLGRGQEVGGDAEAQVLQQESSGESVIGTSGQQIGVVPDPDPEVENRIEDSLLGHRQSPGRDRGQCQGLGKG